MRVAVAVEIATEIIAAADEAVNGVVIARRFVAAFAVCVKPVSRPVTVPPPLALTYWKLASAVNTRPGAKVKRDSKRMLPVFDGL